jgi:hypothetical protein
LCAAQFFRPRLNFLVDLAEMAALLDIQYRYVKKNYVPGVGSLGVLVKCLLLSWLAIPWQNF